MQTINNCDEGINIYDTYDENGSTKTQQNNNIWSWLIDNIGHVGQCTKDGVYRRWTKQCTLVTNIITVFDSIIFVNNWL